MDWRNFLLHDVTELPQIGTPGRVIVFGEQAAPILTGNSSDEIVMAAAQYGQGRVIAISHDGYAKGLNYTSPPSLDPSIATLHSNIRHWLTGSQQPSRGEIVVLNSNSLTKEVLKNARMVIWAGGNDGQITSQDIMAYVHGGGGFLHAMTPWGWLQINRGMYLEEMPFWDVLIEVGICYSKHETINQASGKFSVAENQASNYTNLSAKLLWRRTLVKDLTELPVIGTPGIIKVFGRNAEPVIVGRKVEEVIMGAARYGQGKVICFSHDGYTRDLVRTGSSTIDSNLSQLYGNIIEWITGNRSINPTDIVHLYDSSVTMEKLLKSKIAIWDRGTKGRISSDELILFIRLGGGFIHAMSPKGWMDLNPGRSVDRMPYHDVLVKMGFCYSPTAAIGPQENDKFLIDASEDLIARVLKERSEWKNVLLNDIDVLPRIGSPGSLIVFGINSEPILTSNSPQDVLIAAAEYGQGRVLSICQDGYTKKLGQPNTAGVDAAVVKLYSNLMSWISSVADCNTEAVNNQRIVKLKGSNVSVENLLRAKIAMWDGGEAARVSDEDLLYFIDKGGCFIHAMAPWGWLNSNKGKTLRQMPYYNVLLKAGLAYTRSELMGGQRNQGFEISSNLAHKAHVIRHIRRNMNDLEKLFEYSDLMKMIRFIPLEIIEDDVARTMQALFAKLTEHVRGIMPSQQNQTTNIQQVNTMDMWLIVLTFLDLKDIVAPGCENFPGNFDSPPSLVMRQLRIISDYKDVHSTGVYLPPGKTLQVEVISGNTNKNWSIQIGAHTDILTKEKIPRWPKVYFKADLTVTYHYFSSPFGGLVYLLSPDEKNSSIEVKLTGAAEAPLFQLSDGAESLNLWRSRRNAPGLWADLVGRYTMITVPSTSIRSVEDPTAAMQFWDSVVSLFHDLRGTDVAKHRKQWIVTDIKPAYGYMHAGYPIVTELDIADATSKKFLLYSDIVNRQDNWGLFHEIGHNMTRDQWTIEGTSEVMCNIFTLYGMDRLCNQRVWLHSWLNANLAKAITYLTEGANFEQWKTNPAVALFIYAQLARDFGFDAYRSVLVRYEQMSDAEKPKENQDKVDKWFEIFSEACNHNLAALARFWGFPLDQEALRRMERFQNYLPDDELTRAVPQRTENILQDFPGATRPRSSA